MVDLEVRTIEVYRLQEEAYQPAGQYGVAHMLTSALLPSLELSVADTFAKD